MIQKWEMPLKGAQHMVPGAGIEPARGYPRGILSPLRLPVPPPGPERIKAGVGIEPASTALQAAA